MAVIINRLLGCVTAYAVEEFYTLKMVAAAFSKMLELIYQNILSHVPEDRHLGQ
jgi:hypothetical protein